MPQYSINADGSKAIHSRYTKAGVLRLTAIFPESTETTKKYLVRKDGYEDVILQYKYKLHDNSALVRKIFTTFLLKVLERVSNGNLFLMPGKTKANITLKSVPDSGVRRARQMGHLKDYDIVRANFKIPIFAYDFGPFSARKDFWVYVPSELTQNALNKAQKGELPWIYIPKTFDRDVRDE